MAEDGRTGAPQVSLTAGDAVSREAAWAQVVTALGDGPLRHYVATVDGVPTASASVLVAEGVAGLSLYRRLGFRVHDVMRVHA